MKRIIAALLALCTSIAFGATLNPVQLLNPAGSTSGQAVVSTGSSSAPAWASVNAVTLNGATFAAPGPIGSTTASTGAFTALSASGAVTGAGFGNLFASPPAIGISAPNSGKFTTLQATGLITPTSTIGIAGTATNDNPAAGSIGETSSATGSTVSLVTGTSKTIVSQTLTAGQWQIWGACQFLPNSGTTTTGIGAGISTTNNTMPAMPLQSLIQATFSAGPAFQSIPAPMQIFQFASSTTVYLVANAAFSGSTETATCTLQWQRPR